MEMKRRGWSPLGRVRMWDEPGGPGRSVTNLVQAHLWEGAAWPIIAEHIHGVWGFFYNTSRRGIGDPEPLDFMAKVARHAITCPRCSSDIGLKLWGKAMQHAGGNVDAIVRAIQAERNANR